MARIEVDLTIDSGHAVLLVDGGLDVSNAHRLGALLRKLVKEGCSDVVVDLGQVATIDGSGIGILRGANAALRRSCGGTLRYRNANERVRRLLTANDLEEFAEEHRPPETPIADAKGSTGPAARAEVAPHRPRGQRPRSPRSAWSATT